MRKNINILFIGIFAVFSACTEKGTLLWGDLHEIYNEKKTMAPINVGVILSGGQAPGGHNVIAGLFDGLKSGNKDSRLYGFILGPGGLIEHKYMELTAGIIDEYRNTGGFDMIGSGRTKLEQKEQFDKGLEILKKLDIKKIGRAHV